MSETEERTAAEWLAPVRRRGLIPEDALAAFVVGSSARGWQNARSDVDVYVITAEERITESSLPMPIPLRPGRVHFERFFDDGKRWDVTYWLDTQVDQMLAKVSWDAFEGGYSAAETLITREELWIARLPGCLILAGADWVERRRRQIAESAFRSIVVVRSLSEADDAVEDALGQMEAGHLESATISAHKALGHAIDALLEGHGEYGSNLTKWRPNRFRSANPELLTFEEYWALETMQGYDPADPRPWIKDVLTLCQDIAMRVETT